MSLFRRLFSSEEGDEEDTAPVEQAAPPAASPQPAPPPASPSPAAAPPPPAYSPAEGATRQLAPEKFFAYSNAHLTFGQATDVGSVRTNNEDAAISFVSTTKSSEESPDFGIFIVADGMGGHVDGEKASAMTTRIVTAEVMSKIYEPLLKGENLSELPPITEILIDAVQKANLEVHQAITKGGGTTCTAIVVLRERAYIAHVGDSRAYLITNDGIEQITRDHSMVRRLVELGQMTEQEASTHPRGNELYRALGFKEVLEVDALSRRLPPNSKLMICSDGLWNHVTQSDIANILSNNGDPQEACHELVALANTHGGTDNITVILLHAS